MNTTDKYLIWSNEHQMWWRANHSGYTQYIEEAGRYPKAVAAEIVSRATLNGELSHPWTNPVTGEEWHIWGGVLFSSSVERTRAAGGLKAVSERVQELWESRLSDSQIAERIGVDKSTVRAHRKRLGLAPLFGAAGKPLDVAA